MKSHLILMEDAPANLEYDVFLSKLADSLTASGLYRTVGPMLAAEIEGTITRRVAPGDRGEDEADWKEDDYLVTEIESLGIAFCLLESGGEAEVVVETVNSLFGWLERSYAYSTSFK